MKFARYLDDTQIPEWKKAYIDYRGSKKLIARIRYDQQRTEVASPSESQESALNAKHKEGESRPVEQSNNDRRLQASSKASTSTRFRPRANRKPGGWKRSRANSEFSNEPIPLNVLVARLSSDEKEFFEFMDGEVEKVESFFISRQKELESRTATLEQQLSELREHRANFREAQVHRAKLWLELKKDPLAVITPSPLKGKGKGRASKVLSPSPANPEFDPAEYQRAKKSLKNAVVEHYHAIEMLHNYRVLNMTGFRKALKKFQKVTKIPVQRPYMAEKVETTMFASDKSLRAMMDEMVALYTSRFASGDKKRAMAHLRSKNAHKTHHFSSFRSGFMLGIAIPALASGLYQSFQPETRASIIGWDGLLYVYAVLFVPVFLALIVGLNLVVWAGNHINYIFIFELDPRRRLDYREYSEIPTFLFSTFCYAFWLSFRRIGSANISPTWWPLLWLALVFVVIFNPFNVAFRSARYWLVRNVGRVMISGAVPVEFTDFWIGDQFTSLAFSFANLYVIGCSYSNGLERWKQCGVQSKTGWPVAFAFASLPFSLRMVQSLRRYANSRLYTHLINSGKYGTGILYYLCYYIWRHQGSSRNSPAFPAFCVFGAAYTLYNSLWDVLMDWSLLKPHARHRFLRSEVLYTNHVYLYYVAMITNFLIRSIWVIYIPFSGALGIYLSQFIAAILEALRRWQWNFYRLENEQVGNMDQYRVTREVPLPYSLDESGEDDDGKD